MGQPLILSVARNSENSPLEIQVVDKDGPWILFSADLMQMAY